MPGGRFPGPGSERAPPNGIHDGMRSASDLSISSLHSTEYDFAQKPSVPLPETFNPGATLTPREALELFENAVENARQGIQSLAGSSKATEVAKAKLTLDLRHCKLDRIPSEVVEVIRHDVERLQLAHNQLREIPHEFTDCSALRYLNLRDNRFSEIPKAVFGLPQLEILDLSRNKVHAVPDEIDRMKSLRVFAVQHNNIQELPIGLGQIGTLRMLKLAGNPLNAQLRRLLDLSEDALSPATPALPNDENEKDKILTRRVIDYLRSQIAVKESGEESSDGPMDTPRAQSRFPVQPFKYSHSTSGSESASEPRSPGFMKPMGPPRSHLRGPSYQSNALQASTSALRRPPLTPLTLGNERNRSNSEGVLQATQHTKSKRMGMVTKKQSELGVLDEHRVNRNSHHFRGQSHGSALRNGYQPGEISDMENVNLKANREGTFVRRLSSIPEQKQGAKSHDGVIEAAKGMLYSLHLIHPQILTLMTVLKDSKAKRSSLHRVYNEASMHLDRLDQNLHRFDGTQHRSRRLDQDMKRAICKASRACVMAYRQACNILIENVSQLVLESDQRYSRTLILMLYGSLNEARNARKEFSKGFRNGSSEPLSAQNMPTIKRVAQEDALRDRMNSITPTQDHPMPEKVWNTASTNSQHSSSNVSVSSTARTTPMSAYDGGRSRSNSRAGAIYSSTSSSVASTPRSGESFGSNVHVPRSRSGSVAKNPDRALQAQMERDQFERIYLILQRTAVYGLHTVPHLENRFAQRFEMTKTQYTPSHVAQLWSDLLSRCRACLKLSEALKNRLAVVKLNDPEARNAPDFWRLAKQFIDSYSNLLVSLREARQKQLIENEMRNTLRPIHKLTVDAANLMNESPWSRLTSLSEDIGRNIPSQPPSTVHSRAPTPVLPALQTSHPPALHIPLPQPPPPTPVAMQPPSRSQSRSQSRSEAGFHRRPTGNKGSNGSNNGVASPASYNTSVPATPLSAALGPAAQATIATTPGGSILNRSFEGDVFQRADYLQSTSRRVV